MDMLNKASARYLTTALDKGNEKDMRITVCIFSTQKLGKNSILFLRLNSFPYLCFKIKKMHLQVEFAVDYKILSSQIRS